MNIFGCLSTAVLDGTCLNTQVTTYKTKTIRVFPISNWASASTICSLWNNQSMFDGYNPDTKCTWKKTRVVRNNIFQVTNYTTILKLVDTAADVKDIDFFMIINWINDVDSVIDSKSVDIKNRVLYIPMKKTIVFHMEPFISEMDGSFVGRGKISDVWRNPSILSKNSTGFLKVCDHKSHRNILEWHISPSYTEMIKEGWWDNLLLKKKERNISMVLSNKAFEEGHIKRIDFLKELIKDKEFSQALYVWGVGDIKKQTTETYEMGLDIYGTIDKKVLGEHKNVNYLGELPYHKKDGGLMGYKYHFNAENNDIHNYNTEKLVDGLLAGCLMFYWGNRDIFYDAGGTDEKGKNGDEKMKGILDSRCCIQLPFDSKNGFKKDIQIVKNAIRGEEWEKRIGFIKKARDDILERYQFFPMMHKMVFD